MRNANEYRSLSKQTTLDSMHQAEKSDHIGRQTFAITGAAVASRIHSIVLFICSAVRDSPVRVVALVINITRVTEAQLFAGFNLSPCEHRQQRFFDVPFSDVTWVQNTVRIAGMVLRLNGSKA